MYTADTQIHNANSSLRAEEDPISDDFFVIRSSGFESFKVISRKIKEMQKNKNEKDVTNRRKTSVIFVELELFIFFSSFGVTTLDM